LLGYARTRFRPTCDECVAGLLGFRLRVEFAHYQDAEPRTPDPIGGVAIPAPEHRWAVLTFMGSAPPQKHRTVT